MIRFPLMKQVNDDELHHWMETAENCAAKLRDLIESQDIYVATSEPTSAVPFSHLTKAFQVHEAVLTLCRAGFGSEAYALSRLILEMNLTLRWITNDDQVKRAEEFAFFVAKRKEYLATMISKYQPGTALAADAVNHVEKLYKTYADKYKRFTFWCDKAGSLKQLAQEKEILYGPQPNPHFEAMYLYEVPYSVMSDHVHCTSFALDGVYPATGVPYRISRALEPNLVRDAVFTATQFLFAIMLRVDAYRQLGLAQDIYKVYDAFKMLVDPTP
jgi:uncharacterized protein DUF5677